MVKAPSGVSVNTLKRIRSFSFNSLAFSSYYDLASVDIGCVRDVIEGKQLQVLRHGMEVFEQKG